MVSTDEDGDTLSDAERKAVAEADEWLKRNQPIPHEEVLAEFGLTMANWEEMGEEPLPEETPQCNGQRRRTANGLRSQEDRTLRTQARQRRLLGLQVRSQEGKQSRPA